MRSSVLSPGTRIHDHPTAEARPFPQIFSQFSKPSYFHYERSLTRLPVHCPLTLGLSSRYTVYRILSVNPRQAEQKTHCCSGDEGAERLCDTPKVTQLLSSEAGISKRAWVSKLTFLVLLCW